MHFDLHGIFLEREVGIRSIGDLQFSGCRVFVCNVDLCRVLSSSVLVSSVQLPTSMSKFGGTWDNAEKDISTSELLPMVLTLRANMLMTLFYHMFFFFIIPRACGAEEMYAHWIGATATSTHETFFLQRTETATQHESYTNTDLFFHVVTTKNS